MYSATQTDEMCNLYIMYYTEDDQASRHSQLTCSGVDQRDLLTSIPPDSDLLPPSSHPDLDLDDHNDQFHHTHQYLPGYTLAMKAKFHYG